VEFQVESTFMQENLLFCFSALLAVCSAALLFFLPFLFVMLVLFCFFLLFSPLLAVVLLCLFCLLFVLLCLKNSCVKSINQRGIQCGNSEIKEEFKWKSTFMQEKLLFCFCCFDCCLFAACCLCCMCFVLCLKNSCGNQLNNVEFKVEIKKSKRKSRGVEWKSRGIKVEFQSGNQKTSNKLKTKNKNLGCLVEKMSQVLR
jgi:hypothetical protein